MHLQKYLQAEAPCFEVILSSKHRKNLLTLTKKSKKCLVYRNKTCRYMFSALIQKFPPKIGKYREVMRPLDRSVLSVSVEWNFKSRKNTGQECPFTDRSDLFFYRKQKCPLSNFYGPEVSFSLLDSKIFPNYEFSL